MIYLVLSVALILLGTKGVCGKKISNLSSSVSDAVLFNLVRMIFCTAIGFVLVLTESALSSLSINGQMLLTCLLGAAVNVAFLIGWLFTVKHAPLVTVEVTLTIASIIPSLLCLAFFDEQLSPLRLVGFALIVIASFILSYSKKSEGKRMGIVGLLLLFITMLAEGLTGFSQQLFIKLFTSSSEFFSGTEYPLSVYHFYTYVFSAIIFTVAFAVLFAVQKKSEPQLSFLNAVKPVVKPLWIVAIMAVCLFGGMYLQTVATATYNLPSQALYPIIKGGSLIITIITSRLFFNEKITLKSIVGSVVAMGGIIIIGLF